MKKSTKESIKMNIEMLKDSLKLSDENFVRVFGVSKEIGITNVLNKILRDLNLEETEGGLTSSRKPVKSGVDKAALIERINKVEPDDYSDWSVKELQELALKLNIPIESGCHGKSEKEKKKKAVKSEMTSRQYVNAVDKAARMIDDGERDVAQICRRTGLDEDDVRSMIDEQEEMENEF